jgi:thiamine biosynthesis protein ThiS
MLAAAAAGLTIVLNGEPFELPGPLTVSALLDQLGVDARRVAVEVNEVVVKRGTFDETMVGEGDRVEIVNIVGGGTAPLAGPPQ